jgi:hypothetical protein
MCWERTDASEDAGSVRDIRTKRRKLVAVVGGTTSRGRISFATEKKLSREAMNYRQRLPATVLGDEKHKWVGNFIKAVGTQTE